jgi:two-component system, chemotaxis family, sensor kinase CheA
MPNQTHTEALAGARRLADDLAMRFLLGAPDAGSMPEWLAGLRALEAATAEGGLERLAAEARGLRERLENLGPAEVADEAQRGIQTLQDLLGGDAETGSAEPSAPATPAASSLADDPELVADFLMESREHLSAIEQNVLAIEQDPQATDSIHAIFRAFHTMKGLAGFLEFREIREVSHETETLLDRARIGELEVTPAVVDVILASADYLDSEVRRIGEGCVKPARPYESLLGKIRVLLDQPAKPASMPDLAALSEAVNPPPEEDAPLEFEMEAGPPATVEAEAALEFEAEPPEPKLEAPLEVQPVAQSEPKPRPEPKPAPTAPAAPEAPAEAALIDDAATRGSVAAVASSIKVDASKLDYLIDMVGEMVIAQSLVRLSPDLAAVQSATLLRNVAQLSRITDDVQRTTMSMRMAPIGTLFRKMARLVRDLARKGGKQAELVTFGDDTELDRTIVEQLADPLMHMLRNSLDHGVEPPAERVAAGKSATARIELRAAHQGGHIIVQISDDGRGMSRETILRKAKEKGLVEANAQPSDAEVFNLIFEPGFSTAAAITDISGRGVGMDVVRRAIQKLRGRTEIQTVFGQGTTFTLKLPLTLAIIDGLIVGVGGERYIIPIFAVKEMLRPVEGQVTTVEGRREIAVVRERVLPIVRLSRRFGVTPKSENPLESLLIITESQAGDYCLMVDTLIGKQEVVIKSLGEMVKNIPGVAGGAILGDGRVGLILDMSALFSVRNA